jgi:excisionase family DNA binding protein
MVKTTKQAAERLGISVRRVQLLIQKGSLPAEKIGRDWIIDDEDLEEFASQKRSPGRPSNPHNNPYM